MYEKTDLEKCLKVKVKEGFEWQVHLDARSLDYWVFLFPHHVSELSLHRGHTLKKGERSCF